MEPNLQDVVQFLRSGDRTLVSNAASYLQHLAYGDDAMKTKIRWGGGELLAGWVGGVGGVAVWV